MSHLVSRDEREQAIDSAADRISYAVLALGLLMVVAYRGFIDGAQSWELLALVVLSGVVGTVYRLSHRAVSRRWVIVAVGTAAVALVVAAVVVFATRPQS